MLFDYNDEDNDEDKNEHEHEHKDKDDPACQGVNWGHQSSGGERKKLLEEAKALANEDKLPEN